MVLLSLASCLEMTVEERKFGMRTTEGCWPWFSCHRVEKDWHENPERSVTWFSCHRLEKRWHENHGGSSLLCQ